MLAADLAMQKFDHDLDKFLSLGGAVSEVKPCLKDFEQEYISDGQYMFMGLWAFDEIRKTWPESHVDVGGKIEFLAYLSAFMKVEHVDIRDPGTRMRNFNYVHGSVTALPYADSFLKSLSCLHVAEHVGLGRYGDEVDPKGFEKACRELSRVLAPQGKLYFAVPQGRPKVFFNAHRVLSSSQILEAFHDLKLLEFAGMDTHGIFSGAQQPGWLDSEEYGCGMYIFTKEK